MTAAQYVYTEPDNRQTYGSDRDRVPVPIPRFDFEYKPEEWGDPTDWSTLIFSILGCVCLLAVIVGGLDALRRHPSCPGFSALCRAFGTWLTQRVWGELMVFFRQTGDPDQVAEPQVFGQACPIPVRVTERPIIIERPIIRPRSMPPTPTFNPDGENVYDHIGMEDPSSIGTGEPFYGMEDSSMDSGELVPRPNDSFVSANTGPDVSINVGDDDVERPKGILTNQEAVYDEERGPNRAVGFRASPTRIRPPFQKTDTPFPFSPPVKDHAGGARCFGSEFLRRSRSLTSELSEAGSASPAGMSPDLFRPSAPVDQGDSLLTHPGDPETTHYPPSTDSSSSEDEK